MTHFRKLTGPLCYLSPPAPEDAERWAAWENDLAVTLPLGDEAYIPSAPEQVQAGIAAALKDRAHLFSIVSLADDELVGRCLLFNVDLVNRSAMFGMLIGERAYWGRGFGADAGRLLLEYGFTLLNLHSIMLGVFSFNRRAVRLYQKLGFREVGRRRQARIVGNQKFDVIFMDILADEFTPTCLPSLLAE